MQQDKRGKDRLIIHTGIEPETALRSAKEKSVRWKVVPHPLNVIKSVGRRRRIESRKPLTAGEKLLRNTAVCCALMMAVMVMSRIDTPWTQKAVSTLSNAVTMRLDLDETLGRLTFVRNLMPDTALVFWNMGAQDALACPVTGAVTHHWSEAQPWIEYQTEGEQPVCAADGGVVAALSENTKGEWTLLIDHDNKEQTVYAYMGKPIVSDGQIVERGQQIGVTRNENPSTLYFEFRIGGVASDPTKRMEAA